MTTKQETGKRGEEIAKEFLIKKGYTIVHENWRKGSYEVDLIARHRGLLIFVEVKTRKAGSLVEPLLAVHQQKQRSLMRAANSYLTINSSNEEVRFDIVTVVVSSGGDILEHIEDAFRSFAR